MATVHVSTAAPVPPEAIRAALTDFSERRPALWPNLDPRFYAVHAVGDSWAEVTEGSGFAGGVWERTRYEWAQPEEVRLTVLASNAFAAGSGWAYRIVSDGRGGSRVELTVRRVGKSLKGRVLAALLRFVGPRVFRRDLEATLARLTDAGSAPDATAGAAAAAEGTPSMAARP